MTLKERLAYSTYATAERLAMALPETWGRRAFDAAAATAFHVVPGARRVVEGNLGRVLGRDPRSPIVRSAARESFRSYARYWYDTFRIRVMPPDEFLRRYTYDGDENIRAALDAGTGAIMALPHLGNWDASGKWVALQGFLITAVAEVLRPKRLFELFLEHRRDLGMNIVPLWDSRSVGQEMAALIARNHIAALVSDRDLKGRGVEVEMFGAPRRVPAGPALLSIATGAPLLPCAPYDTEDGGITFVGPPLESERTGDLRHDVTELTKLLAAEFERAISAAPTQWHMFQPAWEEAANTPAETERSGSFA